MRKGRGVLKGLWRRVGQSSALSLPGCSADGLISKRLGAGKTRKAFFPPMQYSGCSCFRFLTARLLAGRPSKILAWLPPGRVRSRLSIRRHTARRGQSCASNALRIKQKIANKMLESENSDDLWLGHRVK